jgi:HSP20 family protein
MKELAMRDRTIAPAYEVREGKADVRLHMLMPGVKKEGLEISYENGRVIVTGSRQDEPDDGVYLVRERSRGAYKRSFSVDDSIDVDKAHAEFSNGVLELVFPIKESAKPRKIQVKTN